MKKNKIKPLALAKKDIKKVISFCKNNNFNIVLNAYFYAGASQEHLDKLSKILDTEIKSEKDTEDYNLDVISSVIDKTFPVLMEAGIKTISAGEVLRISEHIAKEQGLEKSYPLQKALESKDYQDFPFSLEISNELRQIFLAKTSSSDTSLSLMTQLESKINSYMPTTQWEVVKKCLDKAEKRLSKNKYKFVAPIKESTSVVMFSEEEKNKFSLEGDSIGYLEKADGLDLVAMRELVEIVSGESVHPLTISLGFFGKIMPEILKENFDGVILKVKNSKVEKISLVKHSQRGILFSPVDAAALLRLNEDNYVEELNSGAKFYVLVDGAVGVPSKQSPLQYESFSENDTVVKSAEVFLFENFHNETVSTRLYFTPYDYSSLHVLHQHGSVVFGSNDQSFQSCLKDKNIFSDRVLNLYKDWWRENNGGFEEAVTAARIHDKELSKSNNPEEIFKDKYFNLLKNAAQSVSEVNEFTLFNAYGSLVFMKNDYSGVNLSKIVELSRGYAPLSKRWTLVKYLENESGISKEIQISYYRELSNRLKLEKALDLLTILNDFKEKRNNKST